MKRAIALISLILILPFGCKKDEPADKRPDAMQLGNEPISIEGAKSWFNAKRDEPEVQSKDTVHVFNAFKQKIDWKRARQIHTGSQYMISVPLDGKPTYQNYAQGFRSLLITKARSGQFTAYVSETIPDALYLQRNKRIDLNNFTGRLFIYDLKYRLLSGNIYQNGKQSGEIRRKQSTGQGDGRTIHTDLVQVVETCNWYDSNYTNSEGELVIFSQRICSTTVTETADGIPNTGTTPPYAGGDGTGSSSGPTPIPPVSNLPGENNPKIDPKRFMDCFGNIPDKGATFKITVYVLAPFPGTTFNLGPNSVGHTAIGLTKTNGTQVVTQVVGFYPDASGLAKLHAPSKLVDNGGDFEYGASIQYTIDANHFQKVVDYIANPPKTYDLINFNCTSFACDACKAGGISLPSPITNLGQNYADEITAPAGLAASISALEGNKNVNTKGGITPNGKGPC